MFTKGIDCFVKGLSRRVVIVRPQDSRIFEQAIFIIREGVSSSGGVSADEVVRQARKATAGYTSPDICRPKSRGLHPAVYMAIGAAGTGFVWLVTALFTMH